jgi:ribosome biogenesis GTPase A
MKILFQVKKINFYVKNKETIEKKIDLMENQTKKIWAAYNKHAPVKICLSYEQIAGNGKQNTSQ